MLDFVLKLILQIGYLQFLYDILFTTQMGAVRNFEIKFDNLRNFSRNLC
jgi:hypothetical protein